MSGQTSCKPCTEGYLCPSTGLSTPLDCPENMICDKPESIYSSVDCPDGYKCDSTNELVKCDLEKYCKAGIEYSCYEGFICNKGSKEYYGQANCPPGYYCERNTVIPCPPRYYCEGGANKTPIPCPIGTFNNLIAQTNCTACPLGYVCPHPGLSRPQVCPPGYICDSESLRFPEKLCTAGYYCSSSVQTALLERPCYSISSENASIFGICSGDVLIGINDTENISGRLIHFNYQQIDLCC